MVTDTFLVIGAGSIGKRHAGNLAALGEKVELIPYRSFDHAAIGKRNDVAGMVIATATPIRLDLITLCAEKGWPFYVEKPLAWTTEQVDALYDAAAPVAHRSVIGLMMRYHPAIRTLAARDLSNIYSFAFEIGHDVRQWRANWSFADSYASDAEGGGVLLDLCHELDMVHALFPDAAVGTAQSLDHADFPRVDFATRVNLSAPLGTVAMDYLSPVSIRNGSLRGREQVIDLDLLHPTLRIQDGDGDRTQDFTFERNDMFLGLIADFVALSKGAAPSDNPLFPRFDRMRGSCDLVASAWQARQFVGQVGVDFAAKP
ncbi:Gfo/Idh/MocA family protein [Yoonia sp. 2307UL14-13]|uniref:Gfo/Idh/MocA family protein n=1 Tax=Yoonia sp. 2307UL14-13 TaxID=3126506 RepID=UPI0030B08596